MGTNWEARGVPADLAERRALYRTRIIEAAEVEFTLHGFPGARAHLIARRAGVSPSTLYRFFSGKTELWNAIHQERTAEMIAAIGETPPTGDPIEQIVVATTAVGHYLARTPTFLDLLIATGLSWATADPAQFGPGEGQRLSWTAGRDLLIRGIRNAPEEGSPRSLRPELVAGIVISSLQLWLVDWARRGRRERPVIVVDELAEFLRSTLAVRTPTAERP